jgi:hypothetical protein
MGAITAKFLAIVPATLLSSPSESKKSYLLIHEPSIVRLSVKLRISLLAAERPARVS